MTFSSHSLTLRIYIKLRTLTWVLCRNDKQSRRYFSMYLTTKSFVVPRTLWQRHFPKIWSLIFHVSHFNVLLCIFAHITKCLFQWNTLISGSVFKAFFSVKNRWSSYCCPSVTTARKWSRSMCPFFGNVHQKNQLYI